MPSEVEALLSAIQGCKDLPEEERVSAFNQASAALAELIEDVSNDPACSPQLIRAEKVEANDYNPNRVATPEMDLLETSIRADGVTMCIVVSPKDHRFVVVDGFHRRAVATERLGRKYLPCVVLDREKFDRMASTVRHNRARGKHQTDLMASLVRALLHSDKDDEEISAALGMAEEELLRLRQMVGAARLLAGEEYSRSWGTIE